MSKRGFCATLILITLIVRTSFSQTGPGGVGNATGASGQPQNVLWLRANTGVSNSGGLVDSWADQSGNGNNASGSGATRPTFNGADGNFNNLPSITFPSTAAANFYLEVPDNDNLDNTNSLSIFFVARPTAVPATSGLLSKRSSAGINQSYFIQLFPAPSLFWQTGIGTATPFSLHAGATALNQNDIITMVLTNTNTSGLRDGGNLNSVSGTFSLPNSAGNLFIGSFDNSVTTNFEGQIAEVLIYKSALNTAQRQIVENYLSAKYNSPLSAGDLYAGDNTGGTTLDHDFDVAGIGFNGGASHLLANSAGLILSPSAGTINVNGEFVLAGHNGAANSAVSTNLGSGGVVQRWNRTWYINRTPATGIDANIAFDFSEGIAGQFPQNKDNYVLLLRNTGTGNYDVVTGITNADKTITGDQISFRVANANLVDGVYTLGTLNSTASPVTGASNRTWYSYQSGNWTDPTSWTLDGGLFPLFVNPSNEVPGISDNVIITSGRTITMNTNNVQINSAEVIGTLDLLVSTGHNFLDINGTGRIKIAGATDNFPLGDVTDFVDATIGGTVEINGTGVSLNQPRTFRNVEINMTGSSNLATIENNWTLNGNLTITNGIFKFNNDVAIANRTVTVNGNVTVASSGGIRVGNTNSRHEFNLYGDFTNEGTSYFTRRTSAITGSEATDGIVDVNMLSASRDQSIICNGVTRFYRIEISKGTDDTYKASISASAPSNFNLFGAANYNINEANPALNGNGTNLNALGLNVGTVEIGNNVIISEINTVTNYAIYEGAQLWVNGGSVIKLVGVALVPYGKVRVSDGTLTANTIDSGITLRDNGTIIVEGGTVTLRAIRTSTNGAGAVGSYIQSGGSVVLEGGTVSTSYAVFSLTYPGNVFSMSGGTLTVQNRSTLGVGNLRGAIFINSDPANVSITGGTVIMEADNAVSYRVTSRAAFWNVIVRGAGAIRTLELLGTTSGTGTAGVDELTLAIQPLVVLNDFTIENNAAFTTNNANITISGNFEVQNGGTYTHGTNTTTITGTGVSSLIFGNTDATQTFNNLTINKDGAANEVVITTGNATAIRVNGTLDITRGILDYGSFVVSARGTVSLASGVTVGKSAGTGRVALDGTTDQMLISNGATIYNIEINNTDATPQVTLSTGNLTVLGTLTLTAGVFDINTRRITLSGASSTIAGSGFGTTKMIQTAGNAGDGGLELYFDANETKTYPIGTNANSTVRYTPVVAQTQSFSDDGLIRISIEDRLLQLANLPATNSLDYNWRVNVSSFTTAPLISYQFSYAQFDVTGLEGSLVPGSILTVTPFTRLSEPSSDINTATNIITFNGATTGGTFPGAGTTLQNAAYTAGDVGMFTGTPQVFYNRENGQTGWNDDNKWSLIGFNGSPTPDQPGPGDVVRLRNTDGSSNNNSWVLMDVDTEVAAVIFDNTGGGWSPRLTVTDGRTVSLGVVSGEGTIMVEVIGILPVLNTTDIGDFSNQPASFFIYKVENDATYSMYPAFTQYPNLRIEANDGGANTGLRVMRNTAAVTINRDLWLDWGGTFRAEANVTIGRDLRPGAGGGGGGRFQLGENGSHTIIVARDLLSTNSANNRVEVLNATPSTRLHTLRIGGNITQTTGFIDLFNGTGTNNNAILELTSSTNGIYTNASGNTPDLYRLTVNKGTSISTTFTMSDNMTLNGPFDQTTKPLVLQNGLLILDDPAISYTLTSGGADFNIPGTAGLEVRQGAVATTTTSTNANVTLDGLLRISGGNVTIDGGGTTDTNYIEYSNSGNATIEVTNGSLTVAGQIRRSLTSTTGVLRYTQSNGTVLVGNESASSTTRGVFEVLNTGSQFNHSGGNFIIVRGINSTTVPSLWLEPATSSITSGSTITIGNASTPSGVNSQNIGIQSTATLNNLTITGSNNPVAKIYTTPLTVNGNLTVNSSTTLNANSQNVTIGGNFTVDGSYVPTGNTTTFTNTAGAVVSGNTPLFNFYNMTKTGAGTLTISKDITVNQDLQVLTGTLSTSSFTVNLKRHAQVDGTISSTSGSGLVFNGSVQQQLTRASAGTSTLGIITVNNSNGVTIPDGNGYNFNLSTGLRLQQGVFDIGGSLLTLQTNALIAPVNPFSVTNMIQTNSSFTDKGVRKQFPLSYTTDFTFPVGQLNYTPVIFNFSSPTNTTGTSGTPVITVRLANERHPSIIDDNQAGELPSPAVFNDLNNVLQYHWIVDADNVASTFKSTMSLVYPQSLVSVTSPYTEADYLAARILVDDNPANLINKFTTAEVDETTNTISFNFTGVTDAGISAEYFAGVDLAIPDNVPVYTTTGSGNVNTAIYTPVVPGGGTPTGATVIVQPGHNLRFGVSNVSLYEIQINAGATVTIPPGSTGHRLGKITGTGDLRIESFTTSAVLPAAVYDDFFSCTGGGLIYANDGSYEILGGISLLRNLTLEGTGVKVLANNDVTICNNLTVNGGTLSNTNNRNVTIGNDLLLNAGTINTKSGIWSIGRDFIQTTGTFNGEAGGTKIIGRNLIINGGTFTSGSGNNTIRVDGNMTLAGAATFTGGSSAPTGLRYLFQGTGAQTITGNFLGTREFNRLEINNNAGLILAGNVEIERELILTAGNITPGTNQLLMGTNAAAIPPEGRVTSFVNGRLYKVVSSTAGFTFPIGKGGLWRSGSVTNLSAAGDTWDMEYFYAPATSESIVNNLTPTAPILRIAQGEYWKVTDGAAIGRTARVGLSWGIESDVSTVTAEREALKVVVWNDALTRWDNYGGTNFSSGHTQTRGTFNSSSNISFSENVVTLGSTELANPLPVELVEFSGKNENGFNILNWKTASELNNNFFEVERSSDGESFLFMGRVAGNGTTEEEHNYELTDEEAFVGNNYYRLKQVDFDGTFAYSNVILVKNEAEQGMFALSVFPNPVAKGNSITVRTRKDNELDVTVTMLDVTGKSVIAYSTNKVFFENIVNLPDDVRSGVYIVEMRQGNKRVVRRLVID